MKRIFVVSNTKSINSILELFIARYPNGKSGGVEPPEY